MVDLDERHERIKSLISTMFPSWTSRGRVTSPAPCFHTLISRELTSFCQCSPLWGTLLLIYFSAPSGLDCGAPVQWLARGGVMKCIAIAQALLVISASSLLAQLDRGSLVGIVTDPSGAAIANARVTA